MPAVALRHATAITTPRLRLRRQRPTPTPTPTPSPTPAPRTPTPSPTPSPTPAPHSGALSYADPNSKEREARHRLRPQRTQRISKPCRQASAGGTTGARLPREALPPRAARNTAWISFPRSGTATSPMHRSSSCSLSDPKIRFLLVLNEPNLTDQANMTPQAAAAAVASLRGHRQEYGREDCRPADHLGNDARLSGSGRHGWTPSMPLTVQPMAALSPSSITSDSTGTTMGSVASSID